MKQDTILTKLVIGLLLLVITAYMVLSGLKTLANPHQMIIVYNDVVENSLAVNGWFFRDEVCLASASGLVSYRLDEGEKAAANQVAAIAYQSQEALSRQQKLREVDAQVTELSYALSNEALSGKNLEDELLSTITSIKNVASRGDFTRLNEQAMQYKQLVLRRAYLYSEEAASDLTLAATALGHERAELQQYNNENAQIIKTPEAGVFSTCIDGYETIFVPSSLKDIMVSDFRTLVAQAPSSDDGSVGKVATSSEWYYAMVIKEEDLALFQQKSSVFVRFSSLAEPIPMSVSEIGYTENGEAVVVLESRKNLSDIITLREQVGSVIFQSEEGIRIPKKALRAQEDGSVGVYTVTAYQAEFKPVKILAEDKDDYIVKANPKDSKDKRILRSGDEVIITAAELYEGKVVR
jgi:hypothetical protein